MIITMIILVLSVLWGREGFLNPMELSSAEEIIFWSLRVPRTLMAFIVGSSLGVVGLVFQNLFRNALASPFTLGVSSGASFGASLAIFFGFSFIGLSSFLGALITIFFVYLIGFVKKSFRPTTLILSGVVASFFFSSAILFLYFFSSNLDTQAIVQWTMGSLSIVGYDGFTILIPVYLVTIIYLFVRRGDLNVISIGDNFAITRGVSPDQIRIQVFFVLSILLSICVSITGPIAFVGLIVPHIMKRVFGADFNDHFFSTLIYSGAFLVFCDLIAQNVLEQVILPVGIITSLLGAPFFLSFVVRKEELV